MIIECNFHAMWQFSESDFLHFEAEREEAYNRIDMNAMKSSW